MAQVSNMQIFSFKTMNGANSSDSHLSSKTLHSKVEDNYLRELNEDLKLRKQELLEMLKPLKDKNNPLCQKLICNLEEKQRSLQIMRQIMAGKGADKSSVVELIKEAEEMKQNLERKNKMLRKEMEMLWRKTFEKEESSAQPKATQIKNKTDSQDGEAPKSPSSTRKTRSNPETPCTEKVKEIRREKQQRKMEWVRYREQTNILENDSHGKVIELKIEALKNYQKANDLKLSLYLQQDFEPKQAFLSLPETQGTTGSATKDRETTGKNEFSVRNLESNTNTGHQGTKVNQCDDVGERLFVLRRRRPVTHAAFEATSSLLGAFRGTDGRSGELRTPSHLPPAPSGSAARGESQSQEADYGRDAELGRGLLLSGARLKPLSCLARTRTAFSQPIRRYSRAQPLRVSRSPQNGFSLLGLTLTLPPAFPGASAASPTPAPCLRPASGSRSQAPPPSARAPGARLLSHSGR
ncbi:PREDICTED: uncharacterized protein LOC102844227 [Elephantulus edwardii]|uniref:uncharacterized protein LOC102844227 n=1 Tax=Elephantulus edwardii TaxID=28737 RepID=UPI0003F0AD99|nr:PREDICTED: uncharacterized protein LOC102844227 [Elephantulus edwardii]